ncbi:MAG: xanthine dehydrogenase accessory protein XdhC [Rubrivivax sp.]
MSLQLRELARAWLDARRPAVVVEVARTQGSVPRETGTRMLVAADAVAGTIGGGHLELKAIDAARRRLADPHAPAELHLPLGPALGQCCGGAVTLSLRLLASERLSDWPQPATLFDLQLYGAGHVGRAIVRLLHDLPCRVQWIDEREAEFPAEPSPAHVERLCVEPVQAEVGAAAPGQFYLVLTHSHDLDLAITEAVLRRGDFGWLGLIGSATKRARFRRRLAERGVAPEALARLVCPIGVPGIGGKEPEVIAIAVVAQLLQASSAPP